MSFETNSNPEDMAIRREKIEKEISDFKDKTAEKFKGEDLDRINEALDFMLKIHLPQKDRVDGKPFASHPLAVAERVMELSDNPDLVIAALTHDSVEDQSDFIFVERIKRKYPKLNSLNINIDNSLKEKHKDTFKAWSFKEIKERFGEKVEYYVKNMTNHDFNSLAEDLNLQGEEKQDFINKLYAEHVEDITNDPELFTLKLADLSVNIDLHSMDRDSEKHRKLKRKYKSVIEAMLKKLQNIGAEHPLYSKKEKVTDELKQIYIEQYDGVADNI